MSNTNIHFDNSELIDTIRSLHEKVIPDPDRTVYPQLANYESSDDAVKYILDNVATLFQASRNETGFEGKSDIAIEKLATNECWTQACYWIKRSSDDEAKFSIDIGYLLKSLFGATKKGQLGYGLRSMYSIDSLQESLEHEIKHHLDRDFITSTHWNVPIDVEKITLDNKVFQWLLGAREEGFASFKQGNYPIEGELISHTKTINNTIDVLKEFVPYSSSDSYFNMSFNSFLGNSGQIIPKSIQDKITPIPKHFWTGVSPYTQGPKLMQVIACAKQGSMQEDISKETYFEVLDEIANLPDGMKGFYDCFYGAIDKLGLGAECEIFPRDVAYSAIRSQEK